MPSFEERFYLENASVAQRLRRDLALIGSLIAAAWAYIWPGIKVRRAYRRALREGTPLSLDEQLGDRS